jgi:hypothetical protein
MENPKNKLRKQLEKYQAAIPSRAKLSMEVLFGTSQEQRDAAQALLDALPKEVRTRDEEVAWTTECWLTTRLPCDSDLEKSPIGRQTLSMLRANAPMTLEKKPDPEVNAPYPEPAAAAEPEAPPAIPDDGINPHLKQLNWPPKGTPQPKAPEDDGVPHKWQAARPSTPSRDQTPMVDTDFDSNKPLY